MHPNAFTHPNEPRSNETRGIAADAEPRSLRTFTPSQAVLAKSAGVFHWTPEGRRLFDFTSGVLVANLGHNPTNWQKHFNQYMGWNGWESSTAEYFPAVSMTTYNAITSLDAQASQRLIAFVRNRPGGSRLEQVMWAASGSEAIHKAIWTAMCRDRARPMILATRYGFHGKKGFSTAVTGSEADLERDPRVKFISFPMHEYRDVSNRNDPFDATSYRKELDALHHQYGRKLGALVTEPYLGGGGSYHPPAAYLQLLQAFCREHDLVFILDEVQANFGRTGKMFAYETYGLEPDMVVLGKGLGNGVPVAAIAGRRDLFSVLDYGEGSDTWSANPLSSAAVLATLDEFESRDVLGPMRESSAMLETGLLELKRWPFVTQLRGENLGMVWGIEFQEYGGTSANEWANRFVLQAYRGDGTPHADGVHLLGPLAKKVVRVSPPLIITPREVNDALRLLHAAAATLAGQHRPMPELIHRLVTKLADSLDAYDFEVRAVMALICVGLTCGMVGSLVVGNKLSFFSDAMAHTAFAGVALAYLSIILINDIHSTKEADPYLWSVPLVMAGIGACVACMIVYVKEQSQLTNDTVIGVFFALALGLGGMLTEAVRKRVSFDLETFLYGQVNYLTDGDLTRLVVLLLMTFLIVHWKYNELVFGTFNPALARSRGIPIRVNSYLFVVLLAVVVNLSIKAVGVLLINALLVVPAAAAANISPNIRRMYWYTLAGGLGAAVIGYACHNRFRLSVGDEQLRFGPSGMVVVVAVGWFFLSLVLKAVRRRFFGAPTPCSLDHGDGEYRHVH